MSSESDPRFEELLQNPVFLTLVLRHVTEDDLGDCRRVCRLWREATKNLPLRLGPIDCSRLPFVLETFPCATDLHLALAHGASTAGLAAVSRMARLERLGLDVEGQPGLARATDLLKPVLSRLRALSLTGGPHGSASFPTLAHALRSLTDLTKLELGAAIRLRTQPFLELRKILHLAVRVDVAVSVDALTFPSLSHLSRLVLYFDEAVPSHHDRTLLKVLRAAYSGTLRHLRLKSFSRYRRHIDWAALVEFPHLQSISTRQILDYTAPLFFSVLKDLPQLTELRSEERRLVHKEDASTFRSLTGLKSLIIDRGDVYAPERVPSDAFMDVMGLTRLCLAGVFFKQPTVWPVGLKRLELSCSSLDALQRTETALGHLPNLQYLSLSLQSAPELGNGFLAGLKNLQALKLFLNVPVCEDFFLVAAALSDLTELVFRNQSDLIVYPLGFKQQITLLTGLRTLDIDFGEEALDRDSNTAPCLFLTSGIGSFPRLRTLRLHSVKLTATGYRQILSNFPSLQRFEC